MQQQQQQSEQVLSQMQEEGMTMVVSPPPPPVPECIKSTKKRRQENHHHHHLDGFGKIDLPIPFPSPSSPPNDHVLRPSFLLSPPPHSLLRTVSDPTPVVSAHSPNSKKLKKIKELMKQMNQWLGQVLSEGEGEDDLSQHNSPPISKDDFNSGDEQEEAEKEEEEVSVEILGDCLSVNFKCPCGSIYQIILSGNHCYYKLL